MTEHAESSAPVSVTAVTISPDRVRLELALAPDAPRMTTPGIAEQALAAFPDLGAHTCINAQGPTFASVIAETSIPHLLEHLIIDAQASDAATPEGATFTGITRWRDEKAGVAVVEVGLLDDVVAMRAVKAALGFLNAICDRAAGA